MKSVFHKTGESALFLANTAVPYCTESHVARSGRLVRTSDSVSTKGSWVWIPAKARRGICEHDTLKSTAQGSGTYP
jgi:hypothetical protein